MEILFTLYFILLYLHTLLYTVSFAISDFITKERRITLSETPLLFPLDTGINFSSNETSQTTTNISSIEPISFLRRRSRSAGVKRAASTWSRPLPTKFIGRHDSARVRESADRKEAEACVFSGGNQREHRSRKHEVTVAWAIRRNHA